MEQTERTPLDVLQEDFKDLAQWLKPLCRYDKIEDFVVADYKKNTMNLVFYTKDHSYHIYAILLSVKSYE